MDNTQQTIETIKQVADVSAATVGVSTFLGYLPEIAALFTILWLGTRIWEAITGADFDKSFLARMIVAPIDWLKSFSKKAD